MQTERKPTTQRTEVEQRIIDNEHLERYVELLKVVQEQISSADRKAQTIFSANTLLVAALSLSTQAAPTTSIAGMNDLLAVLSTALRALLLLSVAISSICVLLTLAPRFKPNTERSIYFFGSIAATPGPDFIDELLDMAPRDEARHILDSVHVTSAIAAEKFRWASRASNIFFLALFMWILLQASYLLVRL